MIKKIINKIRSYRYKKAVSVDSMEKRFSNIYKSNLWFDNKESQSGAGSTLQATSMIREKLPQLLTRLNCKLLVDVGCGDFNWMKVVNLPCQYIGIDIVKSIIDANNARYGNEKIAFLHLNAVSDLIPPDCDVVMCREVIFHLSFEDGVELIRNVISANPRFLIATTNEDITTNKDINTGHFRNINLQKAPYNFPGFLEKIEDSGISKNRFLGVWEVDKLKENFGF